MKATDDGVQELLELLMKKPELIDALVFNPKRIKQLLKSKGGRQLDLGVDAKKFLRYVASRPDGGPLAICAHGTKLLCAGGTRYKLPTSSEMADSDDST